MSNIVKRIILFTVAIPSLIALFLFMPYRFYGWFTILMMVIGIQCGFELRSMLKNIAPPLPLWTVLLPGMAPFISWLGIRGWLSPEISILALSCCLIWAFADAAFAPEGELSFGIQRLASRLIMVLYPGFFLWWIHEIRGLPQARYALMVFSLVVFLNDSNAWLFGMLFGRHRGLVAVSPAKSLEGFIGGIFATTTIIAASSFLLPNLLPHPIWQLILFGIILGITIIIGDLVESAIKRAAGVKDSGTVILGRGGMLDSIDSFLFAAPLYVMFLRMGG